MIINGGTRKKEFVELLNNQVFDDLTSHLKNFIKTMFPDVKDNDVILCKKFHGRNINFLITINDITKTVSVKTGNTSVVYKDYVYKFMVNLLIINASPSTSYSIIKYHRGYAQGSTFKSLGSLLKEDFQKEIEIVRNEFNNPELLARFIDHFLIEDKAGKKVDYFYYGNVQYGLFSSAEEIKERMINHKDNYPHDFMRIGPFSFLPVDRNIKTGDNTLCQLRVNNFSKFFK